MTLRFTLTGLILCLALFAKAQVSSFPYNESWEGGSTGTWTNAASNDEDWSNNSGSTPSTNTGPDSASDGTQYLYVETSGSSSGDVAAISNQFDLSGLTDPELVFDYHMYFDGAANGGTLRVDVSEDNGQSWCTIWQLSGDQGTSWNQDETVALNGYGFDTVDIRFHFTTGTNTTFENDASIDDIKVRQAASAPSCVKPICLSAVSNTSSTATVSWQGVSSATSGYRIIYGQAGFDPASAGTSTTSSVDSTQLTGLSSGSTFDAYVLSDCGSATSDTAGPVSFSTVCTGVNAPYTEDFESVTTPTLPNCWDSYIVGSSAEVISDDDDPRSGSNHLFLDNSSNNDTIIGITPQLNGVAAGDKWVKFWVRAEFTTNQVDLLVGTMADPNDGNTLNVLDTVVVQGNTTYQQVVLRLDSTSGYNGTDQYVALIHDNSNTFDGLLIDDFTYEVVPPCPNPRKINLVSTTDSSATIDFVSNDTAFRYNWGPVGFSQGSATSNFGNGGKPFTMTGLNPNTSYDVYVQANCSASGNGSSGWVGPFTFRTDCSPFVAPFVSTFDSSSTSRDCWSNMIISGSELWSLGKGSSGGSITAPFSGSSNAVFSSSSGGPNITRYVSPVVDVSGLTQPLLKFFYAQEEWVSDQNYLRVLVRDNDSANWHLVFSDSTEQSTWTEASVDIPSYLDQNIVVAFEGIDNFGRANVIDEVSITEKPTCGAPSTQTLGTAFITSGSAGVFWGSAGQGVATEVIWGSPNFDPNTGGIDSASVSASDTTYTITGLSASTDYEFYIQDSCSDGTKSPYVGPFSFTTSCLPVTAPFTESFDSSSTTVACWSNDFIQGSTPWTLGSGSSGGNITAPFQGSANAEFSSSFSNPITRFVSPIIDVTALNNPFLTFYYGQEEYFSDQNELKVYVRDADTANWQQIFFDDTNVDTWTLQEILLPTGLSDSIVVAFEGIDNFGRSNVVDEMKVVEAPSCPKLSGLKASTFIDTSSVLSWDTNNTANSYEVWVGNSGFYQGTQTTTGIKTIVSNNSLNLDTLTSSTCYEFVVRGICGPGDTSEWVGPESFCTPCSPLTAPYSEDFELASGTTPPNCWVNVQNEGGADWEFDDETSRQPEVADGDHTLGPGNGGIMAWLDDSDDEDSTNMVSPLIDISSLSNPELAFWMWSETEGSNPVQQFPLHIDVNDGSGWVQDVAVFDVENNRWQRFAVDLSSFGNIVKIRFSGEDLDGDFYKDIAIDDVSIAEQVTCLAPDSLQVAGITTNSANLSWIAGDTAANSFQISYGANISTAAGGTKKVVTGSTMDSLTGLMEGTNYCTYVREICAAGDTSFWFGPVCFATNCSVVSAPYIETFDASSTWTPGTGFSASGDAIDPCWSRNGTPNGGEYTWRLYDQSTGSGSTGPDTDNSGSGNYFYTEASDGASGDKATLVTPQVDLSSLTTPQLSFYLHRYGSDLGDMAVEVNDGSGWDTVLTFTTQLQSSSSDPWLRQTASLSQYGDTLSVRFSSISKGCCSGDMAIDDISLSDPITCFAPDSLGLNRAYTNSATVNWTPGDTVVGNYQLSYGTNLSNPANGTMRMINGATMDSIPGLSSATQYCFFVREICAPGDTSNWSNPFCFSTQCTPFTATYTENFDGATAQSPFDGISCWSILGNDADEVELNDSPDPGIDPAPSAPNAVELNDGDITSGDTAILVTPEFSDLNTGINRISFEAAFENTGSELLIGLLDDPADASTLRITDTIVGSVTDVYNTYTVNFDDVTQVGSARNIAFVHGSGAFEVYVDNFVYEPIPCPAPTNLAAASTGCDSVSLSWNSSANNSFIQWGPAGFTPGNGNFTGIVNSPHTISGLSPNTSYDFWVADTCGTDTSNYAGPLTVTTDSTPKPVASFTVDSAIAGGNEIYYLDASASTNATAFSWDFGNGNSGSDVLDTATYQTNGMYTITLVASNSCGSDTATYTAGVNIGLDENPVSRSLQVYPNPTDGVVTIAFDLTASANAAIRIVDMRGRVVKERSESNLNARYKEQWDLNDLAKGMYMIEIKTGGIKAQRRISIR